LPNWKIKIDIYPASQSGLYVVHLLAQQFSPADGMLVGVKYQLLRWVPAERVQVAESSEMPITGTGDIFDDLFQ